MTFFFPRLPFAGRRFNARMTFSREYLHPICTDYFFILISCLYIYPFFVCHPSSTCSICKTDRASNPSGKVTANGEPCFYVSY